MKTIDCDESSSSYDRVPFLNSLITELRANDKTGLENLVGKEYVVEKMIECDSGVMLVTRLFSVYVFKSRPLYQRLIESAQQIAEQWVNLEKTSDLLCVYVDKHGKEVIGITEEYEGYCELRYSARGKKLFFFSVLDMDEESVSVPF